MGSNAGGTKLGHWLTVVLVLLGILLLAGIGVPSINALRNHAREAEVKANLHSIQVALEKYGADNEDEYPAYLIGGEARYSTRVELPAYRILDLYDPAKDQLKSFHGFVSVENIYKPKPGFSFIAECERASVSDPLLRLGYLAAYPRNPFSCDGQAIHWMQQRVAVSAADADPLRNGTAEGARLGTRFGAQCTTMGQVLADPRYPQWQRPDPAIGTTAASETGAAVEYRFWDCHPDRHSDEPGFECSPGQFFYKSNGDYSLTNASRTGVDQPLKPDKLDEYILGVYGGLRTKGKDVIGDEAALDYSFRDLSDPSQYINVKFWPWTRSQISPTSRQGSPYGPSDYDDSNEQMHYGHPNGIPDGIILVVTAGEALTDM